MAEEQIDVYDWQGRWTGVTKPKSEVHPAGDIHICTHGIVTNGAGSVVAQYRGPGVKLMRNVWDVMSVAGHISALTPEERRDPANWDLIGQAWRALRREFDEELGYDLPDDLLFSDNCLTLGVTRTNQLTEDGWWDRTLSINFMLVLPHLDIRMVKLEAEKVLDVRWMANEAIERWLVSQSGEPLATREPDNFRLLRSVIDGARLIQAERARR